MRLPRGAEAVVPDNKVETYCLNLDHVTGASKARVFAASLGLTLKDAEVLKRSLRQAAAAEDAVLVRRDRHGDHYRVDFRLSHNGRRRTIRSGWTVRTAGGPPYLTTAFVIPSSHD